MKSVLKQKVSEIQSGKTLLEFLKNDMCVSVSLIKRAKRIENGITVNGNLTFVTEKIYTNDLVEIIIETAEDKSENIPLCDIHLEIVYEDQNILIIDKSGGIPTHPSLNNYDVSVAGAVMNYYHKQGINFVFRPVNRLDKGTSGLMVIAKNPHIHELLKKQLHTGDFKREYLALVCGVISESGTVNAPIFRENNSIIKRTVSPCGVRAVTHYKPVKVFKDKTLIKLTLETGRTHQIRVHLSHISHPLYGDFLYGKEEKDLTRPALHSYKITLKDPIMGEVKTFISPLKNDIKNIIEKL